LIFSFQSIVLGSPKGLRYTLRYVAQPFRAAFPAVTELNGNDERGSAIARGRDPVVSHD
jgi:hypothetical protein